MSSPSDEELAQPRQIPVRRRRTLAGGAAVLVLGALIARAIDEGHSPGNDHPTRARSPSSGASTSAPPPPFRLPPRTVGPAVTNCPAHAVCARIPGLPEAALKALRGAFTSAVLVTGTSILAQRTGRFEPDLVSRSLTARAGDTAIVVQLAKPSAREHPDAGSHQVGDRTVTFLHDVVPGFAVSISVSRPVGRPSYPLPPLQRLAADTRLRTPE